MKQEESVTERLERKGWKKQFVASEPRLAEAVEMYEEAGMEVHLEPLPPAKHRPEATEPGDCQQCFDGFEDLYRIIFTRPRKDHARMEDELFQPE